MGYYFLIIGAGSIGRRHLKILKEQGIAIAAQDSDPVVLERIRSEEAIPVFQSIEEGLASKPDAVFICAPTRDHVPIALTAAKRGIHLFIEKPISHSLECLEELQTIVQEKKIISLVGCNLRFLKSLQRVKKLLDENVIGKVLSVRAQCGYYLPYWRPDRDYRQIYSAKKEHGGGVLLDNIHEFDFLLWMFGIPIDIFCRAKKVSSLEIDTEDVAEVSLTFPNDLIAQVHLDYLQKTYRRNCEFIGSEGLIEWNYIAKEIKLYSNQRNQWTIISEDINYELNEMYREQLQHFIQCLKGVEKPCNDIAKATMPLKIILKALESQKLERVLKI